MALRTEEFRTLIVYIDGQLIVENRANLRDVVERATEKGTLDQLVLDFRRCGYIDSSGLGALITISTLIRRQGGALRLRYLNDDLLTLFELNKLDTLFTIEGRDR